MKHKQNKSIFMCVSIGNLDNSVELIEDSDKTFDKVEDALSHARELCGEYGMRTYVYKCVPVYRVDRGKIRTTKLQLQEESHES